jgi:dTDP-4-dehydrorhamnose reductase
LQKISDQNEAKILFLENNPVDQIWVDRPKKINPKILGRLKSTTMLDVMTHKSGLGDYIENYIKDVDYCTKNNIKLVQISSDYIYSNSDSLASENDVPCHNNNWYSYTKLLSDAYVQLNPKFLILRGTHKPYPFPYNNAWVDQIGNFDYVNIIAAQYINLIKKNAVGVFNVGTKLKSMYELASQTKTYLEPSLVRDETPKNVSMSLDKLNNFIMNKR